MNSMEQRLSNCFANVFPDLAPDAIQGATADKVPAWDSVAHITLLSAVSEEFGIDLHIDDYEELTSYAAIDAYLREHHVQ